LDFPKSRFFFRVNDLPKNVNDLPKHVNDLPKKASGYHSWEILFSAFFGLLGLFGPFDPTFFFSFFLSLNYLKKLD